MIKKQIDSFARYGGFVAMGFEWSALLLFYLLAPEYFSGQYPISYFATLPQTQFIFTLCYLGAAFSFWIFANHHLKKHYQTPIKIFAVSMLAFVGLAVFPYNPAEAFSARVHIILAQLTFVSFYVGMILMARLSDEKRFRFITYATVLLSTALMAGFILGPKNSPFILFFEATSWLVCQLWIIWISWRAFNKATV